MDEQTSDVHAQGTWPTSNATMRPSSTFVAATEAMQTAVNAMVAAAESLKKQAHKYEEQTATQPIHHALLVPNTPSQSLTSRAASRLSRIMTPTIDPLASSSSSPSSPPENDDATTIPASTYHGSFSGPRRPSEQQYQPYQPSRSPIPQIATNQPAHKKFDYGYYQNLTDRAAPTATHIADGDVLLTRSFSFEALDPPGPPTHSPTHWPFAPAPRGSMGTFCPVDYALELEARPSHRHSHRQNPEGKEEEELQDFSERENAVENNPYRRPHPPSSVYSSSALRDLDTTMIEEPSPVMKIGQYTYIRSDTGDFNYPSLDGDQDQRYRRLLLQHRGSLNSNANNKPSGRKSRLSYYSWLPPKRPQPNNKRPYGFSLAQEVAFVALICIAQLCMLAGMAQALVPGYLIGATFRGTTPGDLAWYSAAYGLTAGTFVLPSGRLGDVFGHKKMFLIGWAWFALWELTGGFSPYVERASNSGSGEGGGGGTIFFIVCRALQGLGPALLVPNGQAMLGMAYHQPGPRKNLVMCLFGAAAPLGFVLGAVMSSLFAQTVGRWEYGFYAMAGACAIFGILSFFILPPRPLPPPPSKPGPPPVSTPGSSASSSPKPQQETVTTTTTSISLWTRLDVQGILLGIAGLVLVNFAVNQAPIVSWTTPYTYFLLVIGLLLLLAFAHHERTRAAHPLVPVRQLSVMTAFVLGCTAAGWACFSIWCYYAFSFLQQLRGWSPLVAAASFAPAPVMGLTASLLTGWLFGKKVRPQLILLCSMCAFFAGSLLWATAPVGQSYWVNCFLGILIMPFGMDMSNPAASILLSNSLGKENQGVAASLVVTTVNYSISVALGLAGTAEAGFNGNGKNILAGYRAGQYVGLGFGAFGILLAGVFLLQSQIGKRTSMRQDAKAV